jgi:4-alpha-glucanotransferase
VTSTGTRRRESVARPLRALARAWGVAVSHTGSDGRRHDATREALVSVLRALGAPIERAEDAFDALRARETSLADRLVEPVTVSWGMRAPVVTVRNPVDAAPPVLFTLALDDGSTATVRAEDCAVEDVPGATLRRFTLPEPLPYGAHTLRASVGSRDATTTVLCAPQRAAAFPNPRAWGVFAPAYALRTGRGDTVPGDFADLDALARWAAGLGGRVVGTLPVLAAFLDDPFEPSPYSPVSRRFWNELYVDISRLPGSHRPSEPGVASDGLVDFRAAFARTRAALEAAAPHADPDALRAFLQRRPDTERYARFRAAVERHGADWTRWPAAWRTQGIPDDAVDARTLAYHRYAQFVADAQLGELAAGLRDRGQALYLDFPLGAHRDGFDTWDTGDLFVRDASVGAPPDDFFASGQDWGFPPAHPETSRIDGHAHLAACIEHHLTHAGLLRIDHVMGLHRLWWVPPDHEPTDGAYVRYPAEELYARLTLASARHHAALIGEDLGTVPPEVHRSLRRHGMGGMHVVQFEIDADAVGGVRPPARGSLSSLDTHDTATFAGFWTGTAIADRVRLGLESADDAEREQKERAELRHRLVAALEHAGLLRNGDRRDNGDDGDGDTAAVMRALLELIGRTDAAIVLVALEDLWLETAAQNTPGTQVAENWRRPAAHAIDELAGVPGLVETLRRLDAARGGS